MSLLHGNSPAREVLETWDRPIDQGCIKDFPTQHMPKQKPFEEMSPEEQAAELDRAYQRVRRMSQVTLDGASHSPF